MAKYDERYWQSVVSKARSRTMMGRLKRMVESQEQVVTVKLVDSLEEQEVLENLLDDSKPSRAPGRKLDYLLSTPWRYPPLPWGSRFGRRFEPSLFYGSLSQTALLAEVAFYRWTFLLGMKKPFDDRVISQHTEFEANYKGTKAYDLTAAPFGAHEKTLRHKSRYQPCQVLGSVLREKQADLIVYRCARTDRSERNVALYKPSALVSRKHLAAAPWLCETTADSVTFSGRGGVETLRIEDFLENGHFPKPA